MEPRLVKNDARLAVSVPFVIPDEFPDVKIVPKLVHVSPETYQHVDFC